jgi:succinate dehydrogenase / fumarate reductase membrane anchor subunit
MSHQRGVGHWWQQRLSSLILIPLTIWLLWVGACLAGAEYSQAIEFFDSTFQKGMAIALIGVIAFHAQIGIQVICEDYIYPPWFQSLLIWLTRIACITGFLLSVYALANLPTGS